MIIYLGERGLINKMPTFLCQRHMKRINCFKNSLGLKNGLLSKALTLQTAFHTSKAKQRNIRLCIESFNRLPKKINPNLS